MVVACEDNGFAVRVKEWGKARAIEVSDLAFVGAIGIHCPKIHFAGSYEILSEKIFVFVDFSIVGERCGSAIDDGFSVV